MNIDRDAADAQGPQHHLAPYRLLAIKNALGGIANPRSLKLLLGDAGVVESAHNSLCRQRLHIAVEVLAEFGYRAADDFYPIYLRILLSGYV
jgi:hypothetical protein